MRDIQNIVLHCTATQPEATVKAILRYWRETLGWKNPGYHYIITASGELHMLQDEKDIANGVKGLNHNSIHVSYVGGIDRSGKADDTRTEAQRETQERITKQLLDRYPGAKLSGHYAHANKACPSFDVPGWAESVGIPPSRVLPHKPAPVKSI